MLEIRRKKRKASSILVTTLNYQVTQCWKLLVTTRVKLVTARIFHNLLVLLLKTYIKEVFWRNTWILEIHSQNNICVSGREMSWSTQEKGTIPHDLRGKKIYPSWLYGKRLDSVIHRINQRIHLMNQQILITIIHWIVIIRWIALWTFKQMECSLSGQQMSERQ